MAVAQWRSFHGKTGAMHANTPLGGRLTPMGAAGTPSLANLSGISTLQPPAAGAQAKLAQSQQSLYASGIPNLIERLLFQCFIHAPSKPIDLLLAGLERAKGGDMHADMSDLAEAQPRPAGSPKRPTTPAQIRQSFDESQRYELTSCIKDLLQTLIKTKPADPLAAAITKVKEDLDKPAEFEFEPGVQAYVEAKKLFSGEEGVADVLADMGLTEAEAAAAAEKVQAIQRGKLARRQLAEARAVAEVDAADDGAEEAAVLAGAGLAAEEAKIAAAKLQVAQQAALGNQSASVARASAEAAMR